jgi:hypothetical protein
MSHKPFQCAALLAAVLAANPLLPAAGQVIPLTDRQLAAGSSHVFVAVVEDARSRWNPQHTLILTDYGLSIEERLKGNAPDRITLTVPGGTIGRLTHDTSVSTHLETGARYLLFVYDLDGPTLSPITGAWQGLFREADGPEGKRRFGDLRRAAQDLIVAVEKSPEPADTAWLQRSEDLNLPAKRYRATSLPEQQPPAEGAKFVVRYPAAAPIVFNTLLAGTPFAGEDEKLMAYWNLYAGDLFRISPNPSPDWSFGNGVFDFAGFPPSQQWLENLHVTWSPFLTSAMAMRLEAGHLVEADIAFNPAFQWTLDEDAATRPGGPLSFKHALLQNLGLAWGYEGQTNFFGTGIDTRTITRDSIRNSQRNPEYRLATLYAEDAAAARATYGGSPIRDGLISSYTVTPSSVFQVNQPVQPSVPAVAAGSSFNLSHLIKIENVGTTDLINPLVEVHLVPKRFSLAGAVLVKKVRLRGTIRPGEARSFALGRVSLSGSVPAGTYYFAFLLRDPLDAYQANNSAWSNHDVTLKVRAR